MTLLESLLQSGTRFTGSISVGSVVKIPSVDLLIELASADAILGPTSWHGVLLDAPMERIYSERRIIITLPDGRVGDADIVRVEPGCAYFQGRSRLEIPEPDPD